MRGGRSWTGVAGFTLGAIGIAACVAAALLAWIAGARIRGVLDGLFERMDGSLAAVDQKLILARGRIDAAKVTTAEIESTLRERAPGVATRRAVWRVRASDEIGRLSLALAQADHWLEVSESYVRLVQDRLAVSAATGAPTDFTPVDRLLERVGSLRRQLAAATERVDEIGSKISGADDPDSHDERPALKLTERMATSLGTLDSGIGALADGFSSTRTALQGVQSRTNRWILLITCGVILLLVWMGAGQVALCRLSWRSGPKP